MTEVRPDGPTARLPVVLMWHMHQPQYRDALTGEYILPWTYLHALKDYSDMAWHLEHNERARAVVNFVPVLLEQIEEYAAAVAAHLRSGAPLPDRVLATLSEASLPEEPAARVELIRALLRAQRRHMIDRFAAFAALVDLAESLATPERVAYASDAFVRDLSVWYHLAWLGESIRLEEPRVRRLMEKERGFDGADRRELLAVISDVLGGLLPRWSALARSGRVELTTSPYAHPILPLLFDFEAVRDADPAAALPKHLRYEGGGDRAAWQVAEAIRVFSRVFGFRPRGCWPSEGAVSEDTLRLLDRYGFEWLATSSGILRRSLQRSEISGGSHGDDGLFDRPWTLAGSDIRVLFRHDTLSDLIGFQYAHWHGDDAAANFVHEIGALAKRYVGSPEHVLLVALDGENAWEHYPHNGFHFLRALYEQLASDPRIEMGLPSQLALAPRTLPRLAAGSWVHASLATWMGDADKNAGWDLLCEAKRAFDLAVVEGNLGEAQVAAAERQLALCESSDWFWWFGDYNPADAVSNFDRLYRRQLANLYTLLGQDPPEVLSRPLSTGRGAPEGGGTMRRFDAG